MLLLYPCKYQISACLAILKYDFELQLLDISADEQCKLHMH